MQEIHVNAESKPGLLALIVRTLMGQGHAVDGQRIEEVSDGAVQFVIRLSDNAAITEQQLDALRAVNGAISDVRIVGKRRRATMPKRRNPYAGVSEEAFFKQLAKSFPKVADMVTQYAKDLAPDQREEVISNLGKNLGAFEYQKHYAKGAELDFDTLMHRALEPAMKRVTPTEVEDHLVSVANCPICSKGVVMPDNACTFFASFITGFLSRHSESGEVRATQREFTLAGDPACTFLVSFETSDEENTGE